MFELLECCRQCDCTSIRVHISLPWSVYPRVFTVMSVIHTHKESQCPLYLVPFCFISCIQMTFLGHRILFALISFLPWGQKPYQHFCRFGLLWVLDLKQLLFLHYQLTWQCILRNDEFGKRVTKIYKGNASNNPHSC